jgi:cell division protein FtsB
MGNRVYRFIINVIWVLCMTATAVGSAYFLAPMHREMRDAQHELAALQESRAGQENRTWELKRQISALRTDEDAVERVAREKFGWCREGEKIYRFERISLDGDPGAERTSE